MAGLMEQLTDLLKEQLTCYDRLIAISEEKKQVIVENHTAQLQKLTADENTLVGRVQKLDRNRLSLMREIAIVLNIRDKGYTLSYLAELMKTQAPQEYELLDSLITATRDKLDTLKALNERNRLLLENALDYIDFSVNLLRSSVNKTYYDSSGEEISSNNSNFFDAKQ